VTYFDIVILYTSLTHCWLCS